jgi:predicted glycoside hydrolase/deacetylase ChbG (UPF0249 family)
MNPALDQLGFGPEDRVVIVHADDVGMCGASVDAFLELAESGLVSSGSVMVPCPWFPEIAARCRERNDLDVGVHLTLTSEWDGYRWSPISTADPASGLIDEEGYLFRNQDRWDAVDPLCAAQELATQLRRAVAAGIDVTHIDTHMCATLHPALIDPYVELGLGCRTPVLLTREAGWLAAVGEQRLAACSERGMPVFDDVRYMPLDRPVGDRLGEAKRIFDELPAGLTYLIAHPATDTPELRAIASDWRARVADFEVLRDPNLAAHVRALGIAVVGWRPFRELMRPDLAAPPAPGEAR